MADLLSSIPNFEKEKSKVWDMSVGNRGSLRVTLRRLG